MKALARDLLGGLRDRVTPLRPSWRSASVLGMIVAIIVAAFMVDGYRSARFDLDEASVWVTRSDVGAAGRINTLISQVEVRSAPMSPGVDVFQRGREVLLVDPEHALNVIDAASGNPTGGVELTAGVSVQAGGGQVAFLSKDAGRLWVSGYSQLDHVNLKKDDGSHEVAKDSVIAVGPTGAVFAVSPGAHTIRKVSGPGTDFDAVPLKLSTDGTPLEAVVVGTTPIVLSPSDAKVQIGERVVDVSARGAAPHLQDGPASGDSVLVANDDALISIPLEDGDGKVLDSGGTGGAVRPVHAGRCSFGAWTTTPRESMACDGAGLQSTALKDFKPGAPTRFRVNGTNVVLNKLDDGHGMQARDGTFVTIGDWPEQQVVAPTTTVDPKNTDTGGDDDCKVTNDNTPPLANDDPGPNVGAALGARPGVATILDVLANDRDADCDVLAVTEVTQLDPPGSASVVPVDRGHALQFLARPDFSGTVRFAYAVSDGRSRPQTAHVTVDVKPVSAANSAPKQVRDAQIKVGKNQTVSFDVLGSFVDPDGDPVILNGAGLPAGVSGTVRAQTSGLVTYTDAGAKADFEISLQVSDGKASAGGVLKVKVVADVAPLARNDHALGLVNQTVTVDVLANDTGMPNDVLTLAAATSDDPETSVTTDTNAGLVMFTAAQPGTYRVAYTAASGGKEAKAFVRFDIEAPKANEPPIAVRDNATVVVGGSTMIDLVANDSDPNLDVLVVPSIQVPPGTGVRAELLEHRAVRLAASRPETQPVVIEYLLTDGKSAPVTGQLLVQVVTTGQVNQPPVARDDVAVVRVGDVVTVPVLANDVDPDGDPLTVQPQVTINVADGDPAPGVAFSTPTSVRFVAGSKPASFTITYQVGDGISGTSSALVRLRIIPADGDQNPVPRTVEARTLADTEVTINISTEGIDPDGDAVVLAVDHQAGGGSAQVGKHCDACFEYTPAAGFVGTDSFTYTATDPRGQKGSATVRIGVAPRTSPNHPPIAVDDKVRVRPGRQAAVAVLKNDSDPDQDPIDLVNEPIKSVDDVAAKVDGDRVLVTGAKPATASLTYRVTDHKEASIGTLTVEVSETAPLMAPVAKDDTAVVPDGGASSVPVDVLRNDDDPDGSVKDLTVTVDPAFASIAEVQGQKVVVKLGEHPTVVPYRIEDKDMLSAMAVVRVPPAKVDLPPRLTAEGAKTRSIAGGAGVELKLSDVAEDPEGHDLFLVPGDTIVGQHGVAAPTGPSTLSFTAANDFTGEGTMSFTATDGSGPTDPSGKTAALTIRFHITSTKDTPPLLVGAATSVEVGGDPTKVSLRPFVVDPDTGDADRVSFSDLAGTGNGVSATINGQELDVTADQTARKNSQIQLSVKVSDGKSPPVPATITVSVVASRKPKAIVLDFAVVAASGVPKTIDVLQGSQAPDGLDPLVVESATVDAALGEAVVQGTSVVFTPSKDFSGGVAPVTFTVNDRLGDPHRAVTHLIQATVKDRPAKIATPPTVTDFGHQFVVLHWDEPNMRGGKFTTYEVKSGNGSITKKCPTANCKLDASDGITNNVEYTFTVRAQNDVTENNGGWSDPSDPSGPVRPDTRPDPPTVGPTLKYDPTLNSGELVISWPAAETTGPWVNLGSPIEEYEVQLTPPPPNTAQLHQGPTVTSFTLVGLTDGVEYRAKVRGRNAANREKDPQAGWSELSPFGNKEWPASKPASPLQPKATRVDSPIASAIEVTWSRPTKLNDKAPMKGYTILVSRDGGADTAVPATQSPDLATFKQQIAADKGVPYTFRIVATNKAGDSPPSVASAPVKSFTKPDPVGAVSATATGKNGEVKLAFTPPPSNGQDINIYRVTGGAGGTSFQTYANGGILMTALNNSQSYTFTVAACNQGQARPDYCGDPSAGVAQTPYGPPPAPGVSAAHIGGNVIRVSWFAPPANGRPVDKVEISIDGGGWSQVALNGSQDLPSGYSTTRSIAARAWSGPIVGAPSGTASARTPDPPPPPPSIVVRKGGSNPRDSYSCTIGSCNYIIVELHNWVANSAHWTTAYWGTGDWCTNYYANGVKIPRKNFSVDSSGSATVNTGCYVGNIAYGVVIDGNEMGLNGT